MNNFREWGFCFGGNSAYCSRLIDTSKYALTKIQYPIKSLCHSYQLNAGINVYLDQISNKDKVIKDEIKANENRIREIEEKRRLAEEEYQREMNGITEEENNTIELKTDKEKDKDKEVETNEIPEGTKTSVITANKFEVRI